MEELEFIACDYVAIDYMSNHAIEESVMYIEIEEKDFVAFMKLLSANADNYDPYDFQDEVKDKMPELHAILKSKAMDWAYKYEILAWLQEDYDAPIYKSILDDIASGRWKPDWLPEDFDPKNVDPEKDVLEEINEDYRDDYVAWLSEHDVDFIEERVDTDIDMDESCAGYYFDEDMIAYAKRFA